MRAPWWQIAWRLPWMLPALVFLVAFCLCVGIMFGPRKALAAWEQNR